MHLYFYLRGIKNQVELFKIFAQNQFFKFRRTDLETGEVREELVQGALRESVLGAYEYVFPREALPEVLAMFGITSNTSYPHLRLSEAKHVALRGIFGAKKIPVKALKQAKDIPSTISINGFERALGDCKVGGVAVHPIGIKEDEYKKVKEWGVAQEML